MFCATKVVNPGPTRVGRITKSIVLPRTVPLVTLIASAVGALAMLLLVVVFTRSLQSMILGLGFGAALGWAFVSYSPLQGESLAKWFGLKFTSYQDRMVVQGKSVRVHIGVATVNRLAQGGLRISPGSINVAPGTTGADGRFVDDFSPDGTMRGER